MIKLSSPLRVKPFAQKNLFDDLNDNSLNEYTNPNTANNFEIEKSAQEDNDSRVWCFGSGKKKRKKIKKKNKKKKKRKIWEIGIGKQ